MLASRHALSSAAEVGSPTAQNPSDQSVPFLDLLSENRITPPVARGLGMVRAAAFRRMAFSLANAFSIGLKSGE
jgi:hypothetical protein